MYIRNAFTINKHIPIHTHIFDEIQIIGNYNNQYYTTFHRYL